MLIVRTILVELFLLQSMVWLPLQSGPIKQANAMMYYNHFTDEKVAVQGRLDSHNPALRILEQNRRCLSQLPRSGFLFKAPSYTQYLLCVGHCFRSWEEAKLRQEPQRSDPQSEPPPPLVHLRAATEDGGFPREASNFRYYFYYHYNLLRIIRPNGEEKLPGHVYLYMWMSSAYVPWIWGSF